MSQLNTKLEIKTRQEQWNESEFISTVNNDKKQKLKLSEKSR